MNAPDLNIDKSKWANLYWDYQLLFYISSQYPLILALTGDESAMIDAAEAAGVGDRIFSLEKIPRSLKVEHHCSVVTTQSRFKGWFEANGAKAIKDLFYIFAGWHRPQPAI